jgi:hypothetical protein
MRIIKRRFLQTEKLGVGKSDFFAIDQEINHEAVIAVFVGRFSGARRCEQPRFLLDYSARIQVK